MPMSSLIILLLYPFPLGCRIISQSCTYIFSLVASIGFKLTIVFFSSSFNCFSSWTALSSSCLMLFYKHNVLWTLRDHVLDTSYKFLLLLTANLCQRKAFALILHRAPVIGGPILLSEGGAGWYRLAQCTSYPIQTQSKVRVQSRFIWSF